jgi:hypothetical protein
MDGGVAHATECLPRKFEALSSSPSTIKEKAVHFPMYV